MNWGYTMAVSRRAGGALGASKFKLALAVLTPFALAGCINLGGGKPPPSLLTLTPAVRAPAGPVLTTKNADSVAVFVPEVDKVLATTRVPVQVSDTGIAYLTGAAWAERPELLFQDLIVENIRARGKRLVLAEDLGQAQVRISGRLQAMGYDARSQSVTVRFDAQRIGGDGVTSTRRFEAVEKNIGPLAANIAPALNLAANDVAGQVADWVD
jgi:cholesterol transport system auxiliary component